MKAELSPAVRRLIVCCCGRAHGKSCRGAGPRRWLGSLSQPSPRVTVPDTRPGAKCPPPQGSNLCPAASSLQRAGRQDAAFVLLRGPWVSPSLLEPRRLQPRAVHGGSAGSGCAECPGTASCGDPALRAAGMLSSEAVRDVGGTVTGQRGLGSGSGAGGLCGTGTWVWEGWGAHRGTALGCSLLKWGGTFTPVRSA